MRMRRWCRAGASVDAARLGETGSVIGNRSSDKRAGLRRNPSTMSGGQTTRKLPQRNFPDEGIEQAVSPSRCDETTGVLTFRRILQILGQKEEKPV
jgi:hypothetical protein